MRKYLVLTVLAVILSNGSLPARNYGKDIRKIERTAKRLSRQAERYSGNDADITAIRRSAENIRRASERMERRQNANRESRRAIHGSTCRTTCSADGRGCVSLSTLKCSIADLPAKDRRKLHRELKKLPQWVQELPAVRTTGDILRHPDKYRRECTSRRAR